MVSSTDVARAVEDARFSGFSLGGWEHFKRIH